MTDMSRGLGSAVRRSVSVEESDDTAGAMVERKLFAAYREDSTKVTRCTSFERFAGSLVPTPARTSSRARSPVYTAGRSEGLVA